MKHSSRRAFSLIELLIVIAVIGVMASLMVPAMGESAKRARFNKAMAAVVAEMEMAQQSAIAGSTYAWVGLALTNSSKAWLVSARSLTGRAPTNKEIDLITVTTNPEASLLGRVQTLENVVFTNTLADKSDYTSLPQDRFDDAKTTADMQEAKFKLKVKVPGEISPPDFVYVVEFNPLGEATVRKAAGSSGAPPVEGIQLVVVPSAGPAPSATESKQAGVILINGLSGKTEIYQK